jgi:glutamate synthase domain-containing protein 3
MTGGRIVVLGRTGRNFAAGMSGGVAYVLDTIGGFDTRCNREMVDLDPLTLEDFELVQSLLRRHLRYTESSFAARVLRDWTSMVPLLVKIMPRDYKRVLAAQQRAEAEGRVAEFAELVSA